MKSYKFSMERVLELRVNQEKTLMEDFAAMQNQLIHQKTILNGLKTELNNLKCKANKCRNIQEIRQLYLCKESADKKIETQIVRVEEASQELEEARIKFILAQKERKIMEKLKEKDFELYQNDMKTLEQKDLDEMAVLKYKNQVVR